MVWTCGKNDAGQLGFGDPSSLKHLLVPEPVPGLPKIKKMYAVQRVWAITEDNEIYVWGDNEKGQLGKLSLLQHLNFVGIGTQTHQLTPVKFEKFYHSPLVCITTGSFHSFALFEDGTVFGWGLCNFFIETSLIHSACYLGIGTQSLESNHHLSLFLSLLHSRP